MRYIRLGSITFFFVFAGRRASGHYRRAAQNGRGTPEDAQGTRETRERGAENDSGQEQFTAQAVLLAEAWRLLGDPRARRKAKHLHAWLTQVYVCNCMYMYVCVCAIVYVCETTSATYGVANKHNSLLNYL